MPGLVQNGKQELTENQLKGTFANEGSLDHLPVPTLRSTLDSLKKSLKPLLSEDEYTELLQKVDDFEKSDISTTLQNHLLKFHQNEECYSDHLHLDHILIDNKALPRNPFLILENDPLRDYMLPQGPADRSAVLTISALKFISSIRLGYLSPDKTHSGDLLTMKPYLNLFGSTRVPEGESIKAKTSLKSDSIIILRRSQFYTLKVLNEKNEILVTVDDLTKLIDEIITETDAIENPNESAIGSITSDNFRNWKHGRSNLQRDFKENMEKIDSALFVLVLDHSSPDEDYEDIAKTISVGSLEIDENGIQTGSCTSRWYDKLQLVVTKNAIAGVIWDSFNHDGTSVLRFTSDIYADSVLRLADGNFSLFPQVKILKSDEKPKPIKIEWTFGPDTHTFLHLSETRLTDLICSHKIDTKVLKYGRHFAKNIGVKSDSLIQVSLQIAHYALYGKPLSTVEPVSTRFFKNSRSELLPIQNDSITKTCQIFVSDFSPLDRWQSFLKSCNDHTNSLKTSAHGQGFEKHLKALQNVYLRRQIFNELSPEYHIPDETPPLIFDDIIYPLFVPDLIASNCGNPAMRLFGLTPAVANGFGLGYIIKNDETEFCLISQYRQGERLLSTLEWVLHQIDHIWRHHVGTKKRPHAHQLDNLKDTVKSNEPLHAGAMSRSTTVGSSGDEEVDIALGGYGYFDIDDLTLRSSHNSRIQTPSLSATSSSTDLVRLVEPSLLDKTFGKKIQNRENLKERFEKRETIRANNAEALDDLDSRFDAKFDRGAVGKKVSVDEVL